MQSYLRFPLENFVGDVDNAAVGEDLDGIVAVLDCGGREDGGDRGIEFFAGLETNGPDADFGAQDFEEFGYLSV